MQEHANGHDNQDLELVNYGNGYAWLRRQPDPESEHLLLTQLAADTLAHDRAMDALFGQPWPTVAEVSRR